MLWRQIHRWLGLVAGSVAVVLGLTGAVLSWDPLQSAWAARPAPGSMSVAQLAAQVMAGTPGAEEIRRLPSGDIVVYAFDQGQAQASRIDPQSGRLLGDYQPSAVMRWFKNLHRSFLLGDAGRIAAALVAASMGLLAITGAVLLARRLGGWKKLFAQLRGTLVQRLHVVTGRVVLAVLLLSAVTALTMSAATFGLVTLDADAEPELTPSTATGADLPAAQLPLLRELPVRDLRKLNFPAADDPADTWQVTTTRGQGWIDRHSGQTLAWQDASTAQRVNEWAVLLHTGQGAWVWALVLGVVGLSIPLFWATGLILWWQMRSQRPRIAHNSAPAQATATAAQNGADISFTLLDRKTGQQISDGDGAPFPIASVVKLFIADDLLLQVAQGQTQLTPDDRQALDVMLRSSDDNAAENFWNRYGGSAIITRVVNRYGLGSTSAPYDGHWWNTTTSARDLVRYYESVADWMLPHLQDRPITLVRAPNGVNGQMFFQKHDDKQSIAGLRELDPALWPEHGRLLVVPDAKGLVSAAQMNVIEFHTWNSTVRNINKPDRIVFDLDPGEGLSWPLLQEGAILTRALLTELGLQSWLKTSGGKGLHILVPLTPRLDYPSVEGFSRAVVQHLARTLPSRFVAKSGPANRVGKIYVDYLRNAMGATTAAAYSARARPGMGVSMPIAWDDLAALKRASPWSIADARDHLSFQRQDPWAEMGSTKQTLTAAMKVLGYRPPPPTT